MERLGLFYAGCQRGRGGVVKSIHLKCVKLPNGQAMNVSHLAGTSNFISGYWDISDRDAEALIGGWLYLHETKASRSYRGGPISGFIHEIRTDVVHQDRIGLIFRPMVEGIGVGWRGQSHGMAWTGGLIIADLPHEAAE
jgi:hypothetical protein